MLALCAVSKHFKAHIQIQMQHVEQPTQPSNEFKVKFCDNFFLELMPKEFEMPPSGPLWLAGQARCLTRKPNVAVVHY